MSSTNESSKKTHTESSDKMAKSKKTEFTVDDAAQEVISAFEKFMQTLAAKGGSKVAASDEEEVDEVDEDEDDEEEVELTREMVEEATEEGIKSLRALAASVGIDATKKAEILAEFEEMLEDEDEDEDEDDEEVEEVDEDDDEADEDEDEEWDRDALEDLDLKELRKVARDDFGLSTADYKGKDQDALIDLLLGEEDEEEEDDDEDDDEEVEELDEDALKAMTQKDLIGLAKELEIKVPSALKKQSASNKKKLVNLILDSGEEE